MMTRCVTLTCASVLGIAMIFGQAMADEVSDEDRYLAETNTAMGKMMSDMSINPSGDVDQDFVASMIPHHQGAVDMAMSELRYGKNEQLRRIAQEIIVEQRQQINAMLHAASTPPPLPTESAPSSAKDRQALNQLGAGQGVTP